MSVQPSSNARLLFLRLEIKPPFFQLFDIVAARLVNLIFKILRLRAPKAVSLLIFSRLSEVAYFLSFSFPIDLYP